MIPRCPDQACLSSSTRKIPVISRGGREPHAEVLDLLSLAREQHRQYSGQGDLASSDGWNDSAPQRNQRTAPLMAGPTFKTAASMAMDRNSRG